ncbi:Peroxisome biogenesis protein 7 [Cardamine amara subsp. amara]|uniref:Peroxin-7 n=1 Tax=Cardamine amara subsp. amara TaxID=228776 RepID=A0ABD1BHL6_CARAN
MPVFKAPFNGYSVKFSPFYESRLAVATAQNFGILGNGRIHVLELAPGAPGVTESVAYDTADAVYDVCWSESHDSVLVAAIGDGSVKIYDTALPAPSNPVRSFQEHAREVHSVDYNPTRRDSFLTASWDDTVKLWAFDRPASIRTFKEHAYCVYQAVWNPKHGDVFASASGDCTLRIWDVREPGSTMIIPAHDFEILSCDWNKYDDCILATSSVDKTIKVWDVRSYRVPLAVLNGHGYAVRKVKFSPHRRSLIASCSYDMTVCLWDYMVEDALVGLMASTGWDELVYVWQQGMDPRAS